jgi:hypothetical protein
MVLIAKRRSTMFKKTTAAFLVATAFAASIATTATVLAAGSNDPSNQIPGYDRSGTTVPILNPDRS